MTYQFKIAKAILLESNQPQYPENTILKFGYSFGEKHSQLCYEDCAIRTPHKYMYLYIVADEEQDKISKGDWCMLGGRTIKKCDGFTFGQDGITVNGYSFTDGTKDTRSNCKKIISSNDKSLLLPGLSDDFIERYIDDFNGKNIINEVQVEYQVDFKPETKMLMEANGDIPNDIVYNPQILMNKSDNSINIKKYQLTWNKDQVEELCRLAFDAGYDLNSAERSTHIPIVRKDDWIKENI